MRGTAARGAAPPRAGGASPARSEGGSASAVSDARWPVHQPLLGDGSLVLRADAAAAAQTRHWLPRLPPQDAAGAATITVELRRVLAHPPAAPPSLALGPVHAWLPAGGTAALHARDGSVAGTIDFEAMRACIGVSAAATPPEPRHAGVYSALTASAALLLNRMGRALIHAAAVVAPDGRGWLLVGDAFAGKTTTTVNLIASGWDYASDDHVVLSRERDGGVTVEGWPRAFHLDRGYTGGESTGERMEADPATLGPGRWRRRAPLGGIFFPGVAAGLPTALTTVAPSDALARLIRQSPWLMADPSVVRTVLALLRDAASHPAFALRLGRDSYRDTDRLRDVLRPATG